MLPDYLYASLAYQPRANDKMFILWSLRAPLHTSLLLKCAALYGILPSGGIPNMEGGAI